MGTDYDAIAVGGGLAGSVFSLALARSGLRVALIERSETPKLKVCGDFLSLEAQSLLRALGVDLASLGAQPIGQFRLISGEHEAEASLPFSAAGFSRLQLDETLLGLAQEEGVDLFRGQGASSLDTSGDVPLVKVGDREFRAPCVALATGKHNFRGHSRPIGEMAGYKMTFKLSNLARDRLDDTVQLAGYQGGYIGACNIEDGGSTLCWLADANLLKRSGGDWRKQIGEIAGGSPLMAKLFEGAEPMFDKPATVSGLPFGYRRHESIHERVFAVGDQIAVIPSFTGDGTSIAVLSALLAAGAVMRGHSAQHYHNDFLRRVRRQFMYAAGIDLSFKSELARRMSVSAIGWVPSLVGIMTRLTRIDYVGLEPNGGITNQQQ